MYVIQEIFSVDQLRERFLILLTMIAFSIIFLSCRELNSIAEIYVAAQNIRVIVLLAVIYYAGKLLDCFCTHVHYQIFWSFLLLYFLLFVFVLVLPELKSKKDSFILKGFSFVCGLYCLSKVLETYSVYFSSDSLSVVTGITYSAFTALGIYCILRWLNIIAVRQNTRFLQFSRLTIDEYASILYVVPYLSQIATMIWNAYAGEYTWLDRSEGSLIFQMCLLYLFYLIVIRKFHRPYLHLVIICCYRIDFLICHVQLCPVACFISSLWQAEIFWSWSKYLSGLPRMKSGWFIARWIYVLCTQVISAHLIHSWCFHFLRQVAVDRGARRLGPSVGRSSQCRSCESVCARPAQHCGSHRAHVHFKRDGHQRIERIAAVRAHGSR